MKKLLVHVLSMDTYRFFKRFETAFNELGIEAHYITCNLLVFLTARAEKRTVFLATRDTSRTSPRWLSDTPQVGTGVFKERHVRIVYSSVMKLAGLLLARFEYDCFMMYNGAWPSQIPMADLARSRGIRTLYCEIANLPGKMFFDPRGVNANSLLYSDMSVLKRFPVGTAEYLRWKTEYLAAQSAHHTIPQAGRTPAFTERMAAKALRWTGNLAGLTCNFTPRRYHGRLLRQLLPSPEPRFDQTATESVPFALFPMQVSADFQVLFNSDIGNIEAITMVAKTASEENMSLYVKPHPAETQWSELRTVLELRRKLGFKLVNTNMFELLSGASKVFTLNSTTGLEALIMGKTVVFMGRTFFSGLIGKPEYLRNYLLGYLLDIDFFSEEPVSRSAAEQALDLAGLQFESQCDRSRPIRPDSLATSSRNTETM